MTTTAINPATFNQTNFDFTAKAIKYTDVKSMSDVERDCHIALRNYFRETLQDMGVESIKKATVQQLKGAIESTVTYTKAGTLYETKKLSVADQVVVCAWALRYELNVIAKEEEIMIGRSIEKYVIGDFDFEANGKKRKAPAASAGEKPAKAKKQPEQPMNIEGWTERPDLNDQIIFQGGDSPDLINNLLEAWGMNGEFCLIAKRSGAKAVKFSSLDEKHDRQTLIAFDAEGKKVGMAYMDKLQQYFFVAEKQM